MLWAENRISATIVKALKLLIGNYAKELSWKNKIHGLTVSLNFYLSRMSKVQSKAK